MLSYKHNVTCRHFWCYRSSPSNGFQFNCFEQKSTTYTAARKSV